MGDTNAEGKNVDAAKLPVAEAGEPTVDKKAIDGSVKESKQGMELVQTYVRQGNELVVIAKILESINRNIAYLAQSVAKLVKEDGK